MSGRLDEVLEVERQTNKRARELWSILKLIKYLAETHGTITHHEEHSDRTEITYETDYEGFNFVYESGEHYIYGEDYHVYYRGNEVFHLRSTEPLCRLSELTDSSPHAVKIEMLVYQKDSGKNPWDVGMLILASRSHKIITAYYNGKKREEARQQRLEERERRKSELIGERMRKAAARAERLGPFLS